MSEQELSDMSESSDEDFKTPEPTNPPGTAVIDSDDQRDLKFQLLHDALYGSYSIKSNVGNNFKLTMNVWDKTYRQYMAEGLPMPAFYTSLEEICSSLDYDERNSLSRPTAFGKPHKEDGWPIPIGKGMKDLVSTIDTLKTTIIDLTKDDPDAREASFTICEDLAHQAEQFVSGLSQTLSSAHKNQCSLFDLQDSDGHNTIDENIKATELNLSQLSTLAKSYLFNLYTARHAKIQRICAETGQSLRMICTETGQSMPDLVATPWKDDAEAGLRQEDRTDDLTKNTAQIQEHYQAATKARKRVEEAINGWGLYNRTFSPLMARDFISKAKELESDTSDGS